MKILKFYFFILIFLCSVSGASGFLFAQDSKTESQPEVKPDQPLISELNLIHRGDVIDVDVIGSIEYDWRGTLTPEGNLDGINFVENPIFALCLSESEVAARIAVAYGKILRDPKVEVKIIDRSNRPFSVLYGAVKTPQRFQIKRPILLNELLITSGGLTDKASGEIQIFRPASACCVAEKFVKTKTKIDDAFSRERIVETGSVEDSQYKTIKISDLLAGEKDANPQIFSGDIITVNEADSIFVIGGVAAPKRLYFRSQITLSHAVDSAGGLTRDANPRKIMVSRSDGSERKTIEADLEKIRNKQAEDIILQPLDIIEVTQKGRAKRKSQPEMKNSEPREKNISSLPLRVID